MQNENEETKKNGPVDYSKFFEQKRERPKIEETSPDKKKKFLLGSLKIFWNGSNKKTKIQIMIFLAIISLTIIILVSYVG